MDGVLVAEHLNLDKDSLFLSEILVGTLGGRSVAKGGVFPGSGRSLAEPEPVVEKAPVSSRGPRSEPAFRPAPVSRCPPQVLSGRLEAISPPSGRL